MGGNALSSYGATRCSRDVAMQVLEDFIARFARISGPLGGARVEPIAAYRLKSDFGDLDVLVDSQFFQAMQPQSIVEALSSDYGEVLPWIKNGPVLSVGLPLPGDGQCLQLDLISTPAAEFDFSLGYFSWNDLGNLVGRVAHKMGLKFGHDGLWLPMRDGFWDSTRRVGRRVSIALMTFTSS